MLPWTWKHSCLWDIMLSYPVVMCPEAEVGLLGLLVITFLCFWGTLKGTFYTGYQQYCARVPVALQQPQHFVILCLFKIIFIWCMCTCRPSAHRSQKRASDLLELGCESWEPKLGPLEEQAVSALNGWAISSAPASALKHWVTSPALNSSFYRPKVTKFLPSLSYWTF